MKNENLIMLASKFGLVLSPQEELIYSEAYSIDPEAMEDYFYALVNELPMTGAVKQLAQYIDSLKKNKSFMN